nr:hypothetical protein [Bradyrhizobium sp. Ec3.3]
MYLIKGTIENVTGTSAIITADMYIIHVDRRLAAMRSPTTTKEAKVAHINQYVPANSLEKSSTPFATLSAGENAASLAASVNVHQNSIANNNAPRGL